MCRCGRQRSVIFRSFVQLISWRRLTITGGIKSICLKQNHDPACLPVRRPENVQTHSHTLTQTNGYITETLRWRSGGHGAPGRSDREKDVRLAGKATNSFRNQLKVTRANGVCSPRDWQRRRGHVLLENSVCCWHSARLRITRRGGSITRWLWRNWPLCLNACLFWQLNQS